MLERWTTLALATLCFSVAISAADRRARVRWISTALAEAMSDFAPSSDSNPECSLHSSLYLQGLANSSLWAVQMLDASSLAVGGLIFGDVYHLGYYEQCLAVQVPELRLRGQHCLATLQYGPQAEDFPFFYSPPSPIFRQPPPTASVWSKVKATTDPGFLRRDVLHWALCVPASCSVQDLVQSLNTSLQAVFDKYGLSGEVSVDPEYCHRANDEGEVPASLGYIVIRSVVLLLFLACFSATVYDYVVPYYRDGKPETIVAAVSEKLLMSFSLRRNFTELTEKGADPKLDMINGGKVISMAGILFGHRALYSHGLLLHNNQYWESRMTVFEDMALLNGTHLVDIFFMSSGCLAFLGLYKALEKSGKVNFVLVIFLRWLRIVPPYLVMIGIVGWYLPHMSEGPLWDKRIGLESRRCQDNWWLHLLFVNNYVHADNQCLLLSWYLACDMQFFLVGIFAIYVLWRWRRVGYALFAVLFAAAVAVPFYVTYDGKYYGILRLYANSLLRNPFSNDHFTGVYVKSHNRAAPYVIGVLASYVMVKLTEANYKFSKKVILLGFLVFFCGGYAYQWYGFLFYLPDRPYSALENAIYATLHRVIFPIGVAWIAVTYYTTGYGMFKVLLAQPIFTPLSRLVYCLVLIHPVVQLAEASSVRHSEHMNYQKMFWMACGDYLLSTLLALVLYLTVEAPSRNIVKLLFMSKRPSTQKISPTQAPDQTQEQTPPKQVVISKL